MSKTYKLGPAVDAIVERQVASGRFSSAEEAIRAGVQMLDESQAELDELRRMIDEGDADVAEGRVRRFDSAEALFSEIESRAGVRSKQGP